MSNNLKERSIYEVFRACRLCGAGGGYKMPIIPSVVGFDCADIELRQKIRECVHIEVHQEDKMPPLICELCVDKVNDFYEFLEMCRQTNTRTRMRLGLPLQSVSQGSSDTGDCILGVTEQIIGLVERPSRTKDKLDKKRKEEKKNDKRVKSLRKEMESLIKKEESSKDDGVPLSQKNKDRQKGSGSKLKTFTKKEKESTPIIIEDDDDDVETVFTTRSKRSRDKIETQVHSQDDGFKKIKLTIKLNTPKPYIKPGPKSSKRPISPSRSPARSPSPDLPLRSRRGASPDLPLRSRRAVSPESEPRPKFSKPGPKSWKAGLKSSKPGPKSSKVSLSSEITSKVTFDEPKSSRVSTERMSKVTFEEPKSKSTSSSPKSTKTAPPGPKSSKLSGPKSKRAPSPVQYVCEYCPAVYKTPQTRGAHIKKVHVVGFTPDEWACDACGEWFPPDGPKTAEDHHRWHKVAKRAPYRCRGCKATFKHYQPYKQHTANFACPPWIEVPDVKCSSCWKEFPTRTVMRWHNCPGSGGRPGGKCRKCNKNYQTLKSLKNHERSCTAYSKKKVPIKPAPEVRIPAHIRSRLRPLQVRVARCDSLLRPNKRRRYNVGDLQPDFALDSHCEYPYRSLVRVKTEPLSFDGMVSINQEIRESLYKEEDYVHWDTDCSTDSEEEYSLMNPTEKLEKKRKVPSLTALSLKTLYSRQCIGKVPKKLRKVKTEKFDSLFNTDFDNVQSDISNLINNFVDDDNGADNDSAKVNSEVNYDSDSLLMNKETDSDKIDFDSLIKGDKCNEEKTQDNGVDNGSETDASMDDGRKDPEVNSVNSESFEKVNGSSQLSNQTNELMKELNDYNCSEIDGSKLLDEFDAQIDEKDSPKIDKQVSYNPNKDGLDIPSISDSEFNFDT